jgi:hypothetical protein
MTTQVQTSAPSLLVQSETLYPGWRAWVNGRPANLESANFLFVPWKCRRAARVLTLSTTRKRFASDTLSRSAVELRRHAGHRVAGPAAH